MHAITKTIADMFQETDLRTCEPSEAIKENRPPILNQFGCFDLPWAFDL
jgi:hypothetical protein